MLIAYAALALARVSFIHATEADAEASNLDSADVVDAIKETESATATAAETESLKDIDDDIDDDEEEDEDADDMRALEEDEDAMIDEDDEVDDNDNGNWLQRSMLRGRRLTTCGAGKKIVVAGHKYRYTGGH